VSGDLWVHDMDRGTLTRFTFDPEYDGYPVWTPDGGRIAFYSPRGGNRDLYIKAASGAGADKSLFQSTNFKIPTDWSRDGRNLVFSENDPKTKHDLWTLDMEKRKATPFLPTEFNEQQGQFSPDGRWMDYISDESAQEGDGGTGEAGWHVRDWGTEGVVRFADFQFLQRWRVRAQLRGDGRWSALPDQFHPCRRPAGTDHGGGELEVTLKP